MHQHMWRLVRNGNKTDYFFQCACKKRRVVQKNVFWAGVTCPHGYKHGSQHFETGYCHKYPTTLKYSV